MNTENKTTEEQMREEIVPTHNTSEELLAYINSLITRGDDYGTAVYAVSMAAVAAFNYVASKQGITGFQASCADLDIIRRTRMMKCPFALLAGNDMLYPQYNLQNKLSEAIESWRPWAAKEAEKLLSENRDSACSKVVEHWEKLAFGNR